MVGSTLDGRLQVRLLASVLVMLALMAVVTACTGRDEAVDSSGGTTPMESAPPAAQSGAGSSGATGGYEARDEDRGGGVESPALGSAPDAKQLLVQTKSMLLRVDAVEKTATDIRTLAGSHGGSIEQLTIADEGSGPVYSQSASSDGRPLAGYVVARVPVARYDAFVLEAAKLGKVLRQSEGATDVTQQHVDLKARLENLRAEEARLRELFDRATRVSDMLEIERELARVRGEAESLQAQLASLEKQAAFATITFELVEPEPIVSPQGVDWGVADAVTEGLRRFVATVNGMIVAVMAIAPVAIVLAVIVAIVRITIGRKRRSRAGAADARDATNATGSGPAEG